MLTHKRPAYNTLSVNDWLDSFFEDDFFGKGWGNLDVSSGNYPATDIFETDNEYVFKLEVPGLDKENIQVELVDNTLTVKGEHKNETESGEGGIRRTERFRGSFQRSFRLPGEADGNKVKAEMKDGILELRIAKLEVQKTKSIPITVH
jgi:HSP20 family protein